MSVWNSLRQLDAYPKLSEEFKVRTASGAAISIAAMLFMSMLFVSELSFYLSVHKMEHLAVDTTTQSKLIINLEFTFERIPCSLLTLDVMDVSGEQTIDIDHNIMKRPIDYRGREIGGVIQHDLSSSSKLDEKKILETAPEKHEDGAEPLRKAELDPSDPRYCGSCYGAEDDAIKCCNSCADVERAYQRRGWAFLGGDSVEQCVRETNMGNVELKRHEGCRIAGLLSVNKVAGNFHFAPGHGFQSAHMHSHDLTALRAGAFNVSHSISRLSFGTHFPGVVNPLDDTVKVVASGGAIYQYFVKVVPTTYKFINGTSLETNQFSVTEHVSNVKVKEGHGLPGVFVFYELSPIKVIVTEERRSFLHFITQLCAIIGGVFTVAGLVDRVLYTGLIQIEKVKIGKFS